MSQYSSKELENLKVEEPDAAALYSAKDFAGWPLGFLAEIIGGRIHKMAPAPSPLHQDISIRLASRFYEHFSSQSPCKVFTAPLDVYLVKDGESWEEARNVVEPDLLIVCDQSMITRRGCIGPPDFVLEIVSPYSRQRDMEIKHSLYQEFAIPEYWVVDPENAEIHQNILTNKRNYQSTIAGLHSPGLSPKGFPAISISPSEIFP